MKCCPKCHSTSRRKRKKRGIYKVSPFIKVYKCLDCSTTYKWSVLTDASNIVASKLYQLKS